MSTAVFAGFILLSFVLALRARQGGGAQSVHDFFVASRQFGTFLVFFLAAGEIYSVATMVGFAGGIYAKGPTYGIWFLGYILLAYPLGYFLGPKIWEAGKRFNAITLPDLFKGYFQSRTIEVVVALTSILFLLPMAQLQFTGLVAAFRGLGWQFEPLHLVTIAAVLAFAYIMIAGIRSSAYVAVLKDILMVVAIVVTGVAVAQRVGVTTVFHEASVQVGNRMNAEQLRFAMSTILFQSLGFMVMPFGVQIFFTAKTGNTIRRTQIAMPLYMLMYPFLVVASYYAISQHYHLNSANEAFFVAANDLLPSWLLGLVAAAAALSGLLVLTGMCLAIGPIVSRNLLPTLSGQRQKTAAKVVIVLYLAASIVMTSATPTLMLTLINTTYYGVGQFFPGLIVVLFSLRVKPAAVTAGILVGQCLAVTLYLGKFTLGGINPGLPCLIANVMTAAAINYALRTAGTRTTLQS
ncbi:sodium:solute symporter family protein [Paraburkholderia haematera]|uniref:Monocarboxylate transport permease protein n=1 Tax=Paraburkholderia haematera TaxID=2793077 RepID=A0ABN7ME79_9BURK|nr:sodium:solute symporter family protein [Paraburkholderia haematera]CAE6798637.1 Monocarboxylate transport permease protein [Paraburkholderia haematera]